MNTRSIHFRLAVWHAVLVTTVFAILGGILYARINTYLDDTLLATQARRARQISETLLGNVSQTGEAYVGREINELYAPELGGRFIRVTRFDGSLLYVSGRPNDQAFDPTTVPAAKPGVKDEFSRIEKLGDGHSLLVAAFRTPALGQGAGYLVEVGTSADPVDELAHHLLALLLLGIPLVMAVAVVGGYVISRRALDPVAQVAMKAEIISQHNLSERLPVVHSGDELERLSISLNHMITRLADAFAHSKRFVADASHELRTPLTVIQGELENLAGDPKTPAEVKDRIGSTLEEVERLGKIVQKLFALSRLDAGEAQAERVKLDVAALAGATVDQMALLAEDKKIKMTHDAADPVYVMGDRARLKQVIVNLLDNAIKYTLAGGSVRLRAVARGTEALIEVTDNGPGIPPEAVPLVFERFYRVDRDRSSGAEGAGLGLSIVKAISVAHGGRVEIESTLGSGSLFRVILPRVAD